MKWKLFFFITLLFNWPLLLRAQCSTINCIDGFGVKTFQDGSRYMGAFVQGNRQGIGICFWKNGSRFFGEWKLDKPEGVGVFINSQSLKQQGLWKKGKLIEENPSLVTDKLFSVSSRIQGCLAGDCIGGKGVLMVNGDIYIGDFKNNLRHGIGICYYFNGSEYKGAWQGDKQHGNGALTYSDGRIRSGFWSENIYQGPSDPRTKGPTTLPQSPAPIAKEKLEGCLSGNCKNGRGIYLYADGNRYEGDFQNGFANGIGKISYYNGDVYEGEIEKGSLHGKGMMISANGNKVQGIWESGKFIKSIGSEIVINQVNDNTPYSFYEGEVYVLLVGVSNYVNHREPLQYPDNDALNLFAFLRSPEGGAIPSKNIINLVDKVATRRNILDSLNAMLSRVTKKDMVIFYFSGHGIKGAFLPIDYDGTYEKVVYHHEIYSALQQSNAQFKMCIADACHAGSMQEQKGFLGSNQTDFYQNSQSDQSDFAMLLSSTSSENSAEADRLQQSVFSYYLIKGLEGLADTNRDKKISIQELFNYVGDNVRKFTENRQSPTLTGQFDRGKIIGIVRSKDK
ncbi:MAG: caspase family protein [Haliscomenobacter sp.]|nr:caspase family protein [Haliscomenobacter sp.]